MRSRFAPASAAVVILVASAGAFDRHPIEHGDTVLGDVKVGRTFDEYVIRTARGSYIAVSVGKGGAGNLSPALGVYNDDYQPLGLVPTGPSSVRIASPTNSSQYRIIVGGTGSSVGAYRMRVALAPQKTFALAGTPAAPEKTLTFGAYPGFEATVTLRWKGAAPVTIASVTGPDGAAIASAETPRTTKSSSSQGGFVATLTGDHVVLLDVPGGTVKWSATVQLAGRLPRGATHDYRSDELPPPDAVTFPAPGRTPVVAIAGESGGPNECVLSSAGAQPDAAFLDGGAGTGGCSRAPREPGDAPTRYLLFCLDGFFAELTGVERYPDGPWQGKIRGYDAPSVRTPQGSGSASLSDLAYDATGRPTGWTEVRRFDATGRSYELVFSGAEYFGGSGYCKSFRVAVRSLPDGAPRTYDYAPFR